MRRALAILVVWSATAGVARAQDAFEIQVYDSEVAAPGAPGFEVHLNYFAVGTTTPSPQGELPTDRALHLTLEPHVGLLPWCEAGAYFQTAIRPDGSFDYAGVKLRFKARLPRRFAGFGFALNGELSAVPRSYEATGLGAELRPIVDLERGRLFAAVNPIVGFDFFGADAGHPLFEPAATVLVRVVDTWQLGVEYYGAIGPVDRPLPAAAEVHRLFAVTQLSHAWFMLHVGVGYGLAGGEKWIVKSILTFDLGSGAGSR